MPWRMGNIPCSENGLTMRKIGFIVVIVIIPDLSLVIINQSKFEMRVFIAFSI